MRWYCRYRRRKVNIANHIRLQVADTAVLEHEATTSRISEDQLFYLKSRGLDSEAAISMLVNGFCKDVFKQLPLEFSVEAVKLIEMKLENSVG